jgi:hypothetical protein
MQGAHIFDPSLKPCQGATEPLGTVQNNFQPMLQPVGLENDLLSFAWTMDVACVWRQDACGCLGEEAQTAGAKALQGKTPGAHGDAARGRQGAQLPQSPSAARVRAQRCLTNACSQ